MGYCRTHCQQDAYASLKIGGSLVELKDSFYNDLGGYRRGEKGMTLIELLVGVGIISVLSAIAIPNLLGAREKAKKAACEALMDPARSELSNRLDTAISEGIGDGYTAAGDFSEGHEELNPRNKSQNAYVNVQQEPIAATGNLRPDDCQIYIISKPGRNVIALIQNLNGRTYKIVIKNN
ncbi:type II secretion system protein [Candidatus Woesearchaeota archaeon]|nr:type II secretion system protein [Candidatus Woesearchaeota archaeon]